MDRDESAALVRAHTGTQDAAVLDAVIERSQGWCAALVLAARAIGAAPDPVDAARRYAAGGSSVGDRVATEAFSTLTTGQRHLLLCVAGESLVDPETAARLTRDPRASEILAELEATGLLVTRVPPAPLGGGDDQVRYRIHPLLGEVVTHRLAVGGVDVSLARATIRHAVQLDVVSGHVAEAFTRLVAMNAPQDAAHVLARHGVRLVLGRTGDAAVDEFVRSSPDVVGAVPETWFAIALDRWSRDDVEGTRDWIDRIFLADERSVRARRTRSSRQEAVLRCLHIWRALMGLDVLGPAVGEGLRMAADLRRLDPLDPELADVLAVLLATLGAAQNWTGDLTGAEQSLTAAIEMSVNQGLTSLAATAKSHLALTEYATGREEVCRELAAQALEMSSATEVSSRRFVETRAQLAQTLCRLSDARHSASGDTPVRADDLPHADLFARFWRRILDARRALLIGSVPNAERLLSAPGDTPRLDESQLPDHLRVASILERALQALLGADSSGLGDIAETLEVIGRRAEAALVTGLRHQLDGDTRAALAALSTAAADARAVQPPAAALALAHRAQLLDGLGHATEALADLGAAATRTEGRRNAVPFFGWARHGTPMSSLLARLADTSSSTWVRELSRALQAQPDLAIRVAPRTPSPRERVSAPEAAGALQLSPREREVLTELARGATYADIAAELYLSENTVKSHISSLYGKLGAARRSEALAVARNRHLL
jgi:ATP/maltotriose-dependent transcriptional regulator MalT